jgi:signal transduction histidine kinase
MIKANKKKKAPHHSSSASQIEKPIFSIINNLNQLLSGSAGQISDKQSNYLRTVIQQSKFLQEIINTNLKLMNHSLEKEIDLRRQAEQKLKTINQEYQNLLTLVTHDLRTPLTVIIGYTDMLLYGMGGNINLQQREMLEKIKAKAGEEFGLLNHMIEATRRELGKTILKKEKVKLAEFMKKIIAQSRGRATLVCTEPNILVQADKSILTRMVKILISLASENERAGKIEVCLTSSDQQARIAFTSPGLLKILGDVSDIFEKYYQINKNTISHWGLGLKLYVVKHFVEAHRGQFLTEADKIIILLPTVQQNKLRED